YLRLCQPICDWLRERGRDAGVGAVAGPFCDGRYKGTLDGRQRAGTAQRWRRNGAGRPVVLAHAALLVGAEREEMVEVVNTFTRRCGSAPDCQADSHLGLSERWSDFRMADSLELERLSLIHSSEPTS
ncbi:lipoate--protein ligase family protein, partial [Pseudomonas aeruginosa]